MVRDSDLFYFSLVLICLTSSIITHLLGRLHVDGGVLLHVANIFDVLSLIGCVTVVLF